jgi:hypothetical protein
MRRKIYGGVMQVNGKQYRAIVCCPSRLALSRITKLSISYLKDYWRETGNKDEIYTAAECPETVLVRNLDSIGPFKAYSP